MDWPNSMYAFTSSSEPLTLRWWAKPSRALMTNQNTALIKPTIRHNVVLAHFSANEIDRTYKTNPPSLDEAHPLTKGYKFNGLVATK